VSVEPTEETLAELEAIAGGPDDGPCLMLNLHRYRDRDAYYRYGAGRLVRAGREPGDRRAR
jgi:hypothetical protein